MHGSCVRFRAQTRQVDIDSDSQNTRSPWACQGVFKSGRADFGLFGEVEFHEKEGEPADLEDKPAADQDKFERGVEGN